MNTLCNEHSMHPHRRVTPYVRHALHCASKTKGSYYYSCGCPIWLQFQCNNKQIKVSADTRNRVQAEKLADAIQNGSGVPAVKSAALTLREAVDSYLQYKTSGDGKVAPATVSDIAYTLNQLVNYAATCEVTKLADVKTWLLTNWRGTWTLKRIGKDLSYGWRNRTGQVRTFFKFCLNREYIAVNPAAKDEFKLQQKVGHDQKAPFTVEEMKAILAAVDKLAPVTRGAGTGDPNYHPQRLARLRALILLMRWSGLAIQDAACLERDRLQADNRMFLRRLKSGGDVFVKLPPHVADALRALPKINGHFFWIKPGQDLVALKHHLDVELRRIFEIAGIKGIKAGDGGSHRFRHTFAVEGLNAGIGYEEMARLMGHSNPATTRKYYDAWVIKRQAALESAVVASWDKMDMLA